MAGQLRYKAAAELQAAIDEYFAICQGHGVTDENGEKEVSDAVGRHNYSRSRAPNGLSEPERTFEIVDDNYRLSLPPKAELIEQQVLAANAFGQSEFLFFRTPEKCRSARASAKGN